MARKKQTFQGGDLFLIPLLDDSFALGQVICKAEQVLDSVLCVFFDFRLPSIDSPVFVATLSEMKVISVAFVTYEQLESGSWKIIQNLPKLDVDEFLDYNALAKEGFVGAKVYGSVIIGKFLNAYYGLSPWNCYYRDDYFDDMLLTADIKPTNLIYENKEK